MSTLGVYILGRGYTPNFSSRVHFGKGSQISVFQNMVGKKRKNAKGHHLPSGFVSDYRKEVETIEHSEGHGSSGRVDLEVAASVDSRTHKRKCITMNSDGNDPFGAGIQVLRISKLTHTELRDLESRLKSELELVRVVQKQVASMGSNVFSASPSIDISSFVNVKKNPPFGTDPLPHMGNEPHKPSFVQPKRARALSSSKSVLVKQCETLLNRMMSQTTSWLFNTPVDAVKLNIPDYFTIIKNPMDLGTVKKRLISGQYSDLRDFASDVRLTFSNAMTYNPPENSVHIIAANLRKNFEVRWKNIEKKLPVLVGKDQSGFHSGAVVDRKTDSFIPAAKKTKITEVDLKMKPDSFKRIMTDVEKHTLSTELEALLTELPENIIQFLNKHSSSDAQTADGDILVDIDALSHDTLFELQKLLKNHQLKKQQNIKNIESSELKLPNRSGLSNSSIQHCKDTSSDSISCSGSKVAEASTSATKKEPVAVVGVRFNKGKRDIDDAGTINSSLTGLGQVVQASQPPDLTLDQLDGESAPSERQVSPEKLYRAALLKSRFADTIIKAREKALEKSKTLDPERLRIEKEELERRQKEEKARLLAEAKAAEEAKKKAAADAAAFAVAEAKKKRELEREAARTALQKMEKTVDINESCQFLKDLDLLRASEPDENLSFMKEISPDCAINVMGSFKFVGATNPLEQLGLYMKDDIEDEEEAVNYVNADAEDIEPEDGEVQRIPESVNDGGSQRIPESVIDGEPQRIPAPVNYVVDEDGNAHRFSNLVDRQNDESQWIPAPVFRGRELYEVVIDGDDEGTKRAMKPVNYVVDEDGNTHRFSDLVRRNDFQLVNEVEEYDSWCERIRGGEAQRVLEAVNSVCEEDGGSQRVAERITECVNGAWEDGDSQIVSEPLGGVNGGSYAKVDVGGAKQITHVEEFDGVKKPEEDDGAAQSVGDVVNSVGEDDAPQSASEPVCGDVVNVEVDGTKSVIGVEVNDGVIQR